MEDRQISLTPIMELYDPFIAFKNLWLGVIIRAIDDAAGYQVLIEGGNTTKERVDIAKKRFKDSAMNFLFDGGGLDEVCDLIDLDPSWVRRIAIKRINQDNKNIKTRSLVQLKQNNRGFQKGAHTI